jgi:hypothetical protein
VSEKQKSGLAFILIAVVSYAIGTWLLMDVTQQLELVIKSLPADDHSVIILKSALTQCGYGRLVLTVLGSVLFGVGYVYYQSGKKADKG